ncbi:MAG: hypothetical protein ACFFBH_08945 [Promethearchaeota archaeon]
MDGFLLNIPAFGFENNSVAIDINVRYNSNGVLSYYEFSYGGHILVDFKTYIWELPIEYLYVFIGLIVILALETIIYIYIRKKGR